MRVASGRRLPHLRQRGVTLIELMVGLTLGLVVSVALLLVFANASSSGQSMARAGMQIENGRYVAELLREDLRLAGFFGAVRVAGATYTTPDPCALVPTGWNALPLNLPSPVQGYRPSDALACLSNRKAGTDAIAVRRLGLDLIDPATLGAGNTQFHVQTSRCATDPLVTPVIFGTAAAGFTLQNRACGAPNVVRTYVSRIYYVASTNIRGAAGNTTPTLTRVDLVGNQLVTTPLAEGIDHLRFEYGFDTDVNGSPDEYRTTIGGVGPTMSWANVTVVKAHFISRSLDKVLESNLATAQQFQLGGTAALNIAADGFTRRAYSNVIPLVNPIISRAP
ncbi:MAG: PilW family protein [Burkholderiaceae bacterium]|nr:PilW family protein [Burkholderiaceae bacterium]